MNIVFVRTLVAALAVLIAGCGSIHNVVADGADRQLMLRGNDPVAYHTMGKAMRGDPAIKAEHEGLQYRFISAAHRDQFVRGSAKYVPAYTGFCASGAPYALKANIGAETFKIVDGRLYLFGSPRSRRNWELDEKENIKLGDSYWENETRDVPFRLQNFKRYTFRVAHYKKDAELDAEYIKRYGKLPESK